jgi:phytoene/squalene synthetase
VSATPHLAAPPAHYENFPVASWLCPPHLRPPIAAIYHFARTADDIADEGDASPDQRLAELRAYRDELAAAAQGEALAARAGRTCSARSPTASRNTACPKTCSPIC